MTGPEGVPVEADAETVGVRSLASKRERRQGDQEKRRGREHPTHPPTHHRHGRHCQDWQDCLAERVAKDHQANGPSPVCLVPLAGGDHGDVSHHALAEEAEGKKGDDKHPDRLDAGQDEAGGDQPRNNDQGRRAGRKPVHNLAELHENESAGQCGHTIGEPNRAMAEPQRLSDLRIGE
ncbi:MAG: hypothetical protein AAFQ18_08320 [Pseudomonadota bacterium]